MSLYLLPNLLGDVKHPERYLPTTVFEAVEQLDGLIAESDRGGRRFLSHFKTKKPVQQMPIALCNKHTQLDDIEFLLEPVIAGEVWGLVSDAGLPCHADPGSELVLRARKKQLPISAFAGPSSISLALQLSGLSGQRFHFHGYLAKDPQARAEQVKHFDGGTTHIMIEAPHRNEHTLETLLEVLPETALLCVAKNLTLETELVETWPVREWRNRKKPALKGEPAIFLTLIQARSPQNRKKAFRGR